MYLLQHLNQSPHVLRILDIVRFHLLDILGDWHVGAFEDIYGEVQVLQGQLTCQSLVIDQLLDFFLVGRRANY